MKKLNIALFSMLAVLPALAQTQPDPLTIEDMKTPPSPAFVLMGIAPTAVERPTTPRALGLALLNAVEDDSGSLPQNFSVEVAPYWMSPRPALTFDQYDQAGFWQSMKQTFSVSFATKGEEATEGTLMGAGARASWMIGKRSELAQQVLAAYHAKAGDLAASGGPPQPGQPPPDFSAQLRPYVVSLRDAVKQGRWVIDGAAAVTGRFPENDTSHARTEKTALWITPAYRFVRGTLNADGTLTSVPTVDFIGVARYIHDRTAAKDGDGIDIGGRLLWESDRIAVSGEHVQRLNIDKPTQRTTALVEFKVNDDLYLSATFGKDFEDQTEKGDLQAILGVNWNIGKKPVLLPPAP